METQHQFLNLLNLMIRQVAREEAQLILKEQSKLTEGKLSSKSSEQETSAFPYDSNSSVKWLLPDYGINIFHSVLFEQNKLLCPFESFREIFIISDAEPVWWTGKSGELACLLGTLHSRNVVSTSESYWETITSFFCHSDKKKFSHSSLCSQYSQSQFSDDFENLIIEIIKRLQVEQKNLLSKIKSG